MISGGSGALTKCSTLSLLISYKIQRVYTVAASSKAVNELEGI